MKIRTIHRKKGFTLVEIMVSLSIFSIVMVICMGSIVSVLDANRKSQSLRAVMDNMSFTLDSITRTVRFGENYHCYDTGTLTTPQDCPGGGQVLNLKGPDGLQVKFWLSGNKIMKTDMATGVVSSMTSNDVTITNLQFFVFGSGADLYQPRVVMVVSGFAGSKPTSKSTFTLETSSSERKFDFH